MKLNLFKVALLVPLLLFYFYGHSQDNRIKADEKGGGGNTTIVMNFKKNADRYYTKFSQLNPLHLEPILISPPPHSLDTSNNLKTLIKLDLAAPAYLALGFNLFYIEPGDSLDVSYETFSATKTEFKDTLIINHGNVFFIARNGKPSQAPRNFENSIFNTIGNIKLASQMTEYLTVEHINELLSRYIELNFQGYPHLNNSNSIFEKVNGIILNDFYRHLIYRLKFVYKNTKDQLLKNAIQQSVKNMLNYARMQQETAIDPANLGKYEAMYVFFKEMNLDESAIQTKFEACNDTIKQYILINLLNDGLLSDSADSKTMLLSKVTYPPFRDFALKVYQKPNRGIEKSGYINNSIRNVALFDAEDKKVLFGDLFKTTQQPFIILDFCGTWCKPCLDAIAKYKQTKNLDNSKQIRPIWLFFENDKTKWMDVVTKNDLIAENCFAVIGDSSRELMKEFALLFDWQGEFSHHFVFSTDGKIVQKNAASLSAFSENELTPFMKTNKEKLSTPALPAGIK